VLPAARVPLRGWRSCRGDGSPRDTGTGTPKALDYKAISSHCA